MTIRNDEWENDDESTIFGQKISQPVKFFKTPTQMILSVHNSFVIDSENDSCEEAANQGNISKKGTNLKFFDLM